MTRATATCPNPGDGAAGFVHAWRRILPRRWRASWWGQGEAAAPAAALAPRLREDIGLDPPEPGADGRLGRDFTSYLQYL